MNRKLDVAAASTTSEGLRRLFSLRRANRALVLVRKIVADLVGEYARAMELQEILELEQRYGSPEPLDGLRRDVSTTVSRIRGFVKELEAVGVEVQDFAGGIVDFPASSAGREIRFCWRLGEKQVLHWHGVDEGLAGRRPISELAGVDRSAGAGTS